MGTHIRFNDDEYQPSDSEDDMSKENQELLRKVRNKGNSYSDSEDEVLGVQSDSSEQSDIALSDVEGQGEDDDIPDRKAWGKNKRHYYSTDYVDPDFDGYQEKDTAMAELEEEEARNLQNALAKSMDDEDFTLGFVTTEKTDDEKLAQEEVIKSDISKLSKRQKMQLLQKESPEFFGLIDDYEKKMTTVTDLLYPVIKLKNEGKIKEGKAMDFVKTYYELILNANIYMYLLLKASRVNVKNHPVIKRLYQYRQLLEQMYPIFEEIVRPQLEILIEQNGNSNETLKKKKTLKLLSKLMEADRKSDDYIEEVKKKKKGDKNNQIVEKEEEIKETLEESSSGETEESENEADEKEIEVDKNEIEVEKRGITYQIAKNKGLTPHRKKDQRNPRVKHRNKFRKAKIRRKGAVREVRRELTRYGGEISGIKASVSKSIKIKS